MVQAQSWEKLQAQVQLGSPASAVVESEEHEALELPVVSVMICIDCQGRGETNGSKQLRPLPVSLWSGAKRLRDA